MTPEWLTSPEAFKEHLEAQGGFDRSIGLTEDVARIYQKALFMGSSREDAFQEATAGLEINNHVTWEYVRGVLENLPGPGEI